MAEIIIFENEIITPKIGDKLYTGMRDQYEWTVCEFSSHFDVIKRKGIFYKSKTIKAKRKGNKKDFNYVSFNDNNIVKDLEELREINKQTIKK